MNRFVDSFFRTLTFLTRIPVPGKWNLKDDSVPLHPGSFPFVGALIGSILAVAAYLFSGLPRPVSGVFLLIAWIAITGGFHWDGWADSWETALATVSLEDKKRIRKDPHLGVYGVLSLAVGVLAKGVFLGTLRLNPMDLLAVAAWGRGGLPVLIYLTRIFAPDIPVSEGMGKGFMSKVNPANALLCAGISGGFVLLSAGWVALGTLTAAMTVSSIAMGWVLRRQDALSGDFMGFGIEFLEIAGILAIGLANGAGLPTPLHVAWAHW